MTDAPADLDTTDIYWTVTDPDGNVVQSGSLSRAEMSTELAEALGFNPNTSQE